MSTNTTAVAIPDSAPAYLAELMKSNPAFASVNEDSIAGISGGMPPFIGTNSSRFVIKEGGESNVILNKDGDPITSLGCVILAAKKELDKRLYLTGYDPKAEATAPDCQSFDGIKPDPASPNKQHESCAGCWANAFKSGTNQEGQSTNGKACADIKRIAMFANGKTYGFNVPPASLKAYKAYVKDLTERGIPLAAVITKIGFDFETPQILTFTYTAMLSQEQLPKIVEICNSDEVKEILTFGNSQGAAPKAIENKPVETKKEEPKQQPATPPPSRGKGGKKQAEKEQMDLGLDPATQPETQQGQPTTKPEDVVIETAAVETTTTEITDDDLSAALGL